MNKIISKYLPIVHRTAIAANGVGGKNGNRFRVAALMFRKNEIINISTNSWKTHPMIARYTEFPFIHAESGCVIKAGVENCEGASILVARVKLDNTLALAKPCCTCEPILRDVGFKEVFFTTDFNSVDHILF